MDLSFQEIVAAIESIYEDELKPFGRVLLQRLRERMAARVAAAQGLDVSFVDAENMPKINPKRLRRICDLCRQVHVEPEGGPEFSATLVWRPCHFLNVRSPVDLYPEEMWEAFAMHLECVGPADRRLPRGRYACAKVLRNRGLHFFEGYSLGQICHIVELAKGQKRLLGFRDGALMPYMQSDAWIKQQCAVAQAPMGHECDLPLASWNDVRAGLWSLLNSQMQAKPGVVRIASIHRLFQSHFQLQLSVTALGHTRLQEVLRDPRLTDMYTVESQKGAPFLSIRCFAVAHRMEGFVGVHGAYDGDYYGVCAEALDAMVPASSPTRSTASTASHELGDSQEEMTYSL